MRLKDKVAIVTGATRGIGRAIAVRFGQEGARVAVVGRDEEMGRETVRLIEAAGGQAMFVPTDVSDSAQVQAMVDAVVIAGAASTSWSTTPPSAPLKTFWR